MSKETIRVHVKIEKANNLLFLIELFSVNVLYTYIEYCYRAH